MTTLAGKHISQNGLGLMRMTNPADLTPDDKAFKVLKAALAAGANYWNGADFYGPPTNNSLHLLNRYFTKYPEDADKVVLSIKTGIADKQSLLMDCSRGSLRESCDNALKILDGKKQIDIFGCARVDPKVPIEDSIRALSELKQEGKVNGIQLSEVRAETIRRAAKVAKIDMVEAEVSLWSPDVFENGVAEACAENGIVLVAHTPLGAGMLTGRFRSIDDLPPNSFFNVLPRFQPDTFPRNVQLVEALDRLAKDKGCTTGMLALNWVKAQSRKPHMPVLVPIAGARAESRVQENTTDIDLNEDDLAQITFILRTCPVAGPRTFAALQELNEY